MFFVLFHYHHSNVPAIASSGVCFIDKYFIAECETVCRCQGFCVGTIMGNGLIV